ncbi:hypothetical protein BCR39DRAFT_251529 [Naematelia encephala]|uniref:Uncharacterized protein n=1 Tax=Naematelia encephala TaxID=71784 RepID=A0A1Y2AWR6_9TREE|nr:hypothetical protein BCR39DRAFT_251529 [Naematelia encephala]
MYSWNKSGFTVQDMYRYYALPFFCSFIAAILAFLSSRLLANSFSFSSLDICAKLGAGVAEGEGDDGLSSTSPQVSNVAAGVCTGVAVFGGIVAGTAADILGAGVGLGGLGCTVLVVVVVVVVPFGFEVGLT